MPKKFSKTIVDVVGALDREEIPVKEIQRRLNEGEAGLDYKVDISERSVYDLRAKFYVDERAAETHEDAAAHSIASLKQLIIDRVAREVAYLERLPMGKLGGKPAKDLHQLFIKLDDMQRRERKREKEQRGRSPAKSSPNGSSQPETAMEKLAREQREAESASS